MDSKTPDNSGDLFGDLAEPALLTSKNSGKFRWTATKTRNKSLRACKNSGKFGIVLKKLGQVPGSPSISSPRILFFGFSLAVAGHIAFFFCPQVRLIGSAREAKEPAGRRRQQCPLPDVALCLEYPSEGRAISPRSSPGTEICPIGKDGQTVFAKRIDAARGGFRNQNQLLLLIGGCAN